MSELLEKIKHRTSVRAFRGDAFWQADKDKILACAEKAVNPFDIPIEWKILDAGQYGLTSPVISGTDTWLAGKMKKVPYAEEAFGYSFEEIVLYADECGIGTTIVAGTMNREAFEKAMEVGTDEVLPCATPLGYPAKKRALKELAMRKAISADKRIELQEFVFSKSFDSPAGNDVIGNLNDALEMVRWAPSAVNKQPWRIVLDGNKVHFYKKGSKGFQDADTGWDIQKIDIGIALKHFVVGSEEAGYKPQILVEDPQIAAPENVEYRVSCILQ